MNQELTADPIRDTNWCLWYVWTPQGMRPLTADVVNNQYYIAFEDYQKLCEKMDIYKKALEKLAISKDPGQKFTSMSAEPYEQGLTSQWMKDSKIAADALEKACKLNHTPA